MFIKSQTKHINEEKLYAAQLFIQQNLTENLSLAVIATKIGLSGSYFHQLFKNRFNETPKSYVNRLRIEKSYYAIRVTNDSILKIALDHGFNNPETFSRAYKKHFHVSPSSVPRTNYINRPPQQPHVNHVEYLDHSIKSNNCGLRVVYLNQIKVKFKRHIGPYEEVPYVANKESEWHKLQSEADQLKCPVPVYIGIPLDNPRITAADKLRYDMCILQTTKPINNNIEIKTLAAGYYAVLTHAGCYAELSESYERLFSAAIQLNGFQIAAKPVFEVLLDVSAKTPREHTWTDLYLPLKKA